MTRSNMRVLRASGTGLAQTETERRTNVYKRKEEYG